MVGKHEAVYLPTLVTEYSVQKVAILGKSFCKFRYFTPLVGDTLQFRLVNEWLLRGQTWLLEGEEKHLID